MSAPSDACITAFERQYDTTWADPALRNERLSWIACWKAASACQDCAVQQGYMPAQAVVQIQEPERNKPSMSMHVSVEDYQRALADWEAEQSQLAAVQQGVQPAAPMFWVRLLRDGLYEGPVHNNSTAGKLLRDEKPEEWHPLYLQSATQQGLDAQNEWEGIESLPVCDDLIWLYCQDTNTIDGPIAPCPSFVDSWTHWAYANAPSTAVIDAAQAKQGGA